MATAKATAAVAAGLQAGNRKERGDTEVGMAKVAKGSGSKGIKSVDLGWNEKGPNLDSLFERSLSGSVLQPGTVEGTEAALNSGPGQVTGGARNLPLDLIDHNPYQARQAFGEQSLQELADSIHEEHDSTKARKRVSMSEGREEDNLRVRRTRLALRNALLQLIEEKGFDAITVQDLAERAMIHRVAFYNYYVDKYDLLERTMRDMLNEMAEPFATLFQSPGDAKVY